MAEDLAAVFSQKFLVTTDSNSTEAKHPRLDEYKEKNFKLGDQTYRRNEQLEHQKKKRFDAQNYARKLAAGDLQEEDVENEDYGMEVGNYKKKGKKTSRPYRNQLMLSEWLVDPPSDLEERWTMVICPTGKRVLLVAHKGSTMMFSKGGYMIKRFPSLLPGGYRFEQQGFQSTILDCVFDEASSTIWVLDMMCYKGYPLYDCESTFRFFWISTKLFDESTENLKETSRYNKFKFLPCPNAGCSENSIVDAVTSMYQFQVDGLLFYHNQAYYRPGRTPLVGWLKPFMLPKILSIYLPETFLDQFQDASLSYDRNSLKEENAKLQNTTRDNLEQDRRIHIKTADMDT